MPLPSSPATSDTLHQPINPGNLKTELQRYVPSFELLLVGWLLYPAINGAYTELYAGIAPEAATIKENE